MHATGVIYPANSILEENKDNRRKFSCITQDTCFHTAKMQSCRYIKKSRWIPHPVKLINHFPQDIKNIIAVKQKDVLQGSKAIAIENKIPIEENVFEAIRFHRDNDHGWYWVEALEEGY